MITDEQAADLQPGDVVEIRNERWPEGTVARGPIWDDHQTLRVADIAVRWPDGRPHESPLRTLAVISRAPRPLYVNHPRTEPHLNDVVCDAEDASPPTVWLCDPSGDWWTSHDGTVRMYERDMLPARLRLLVDGETGQVVPS